MKIRPQTIRLAGDTELVFSEFEGGVANYLDVTSGGRRHRIILAREGSILNIVGLPSLTSQREPSKV